MSCLYVSETYEEADNWGKFFAKIGRPTYHIVKLKLAKEYWENKDFPNQKSICEILVDGEITVLEIVKEINANISNG